MKEFAQISSRFTSDRDTSFYLRFKRVLLHNLSCRNGFDLQDNDRARKINRPFPSFLVPLFQSESNCETILMKITLICMKMKLYAELIFI